ncbi:MAG: hypothetical protein IPM32_10840 [Ignavibacteriae bacterium]|nr:hypothetical protein [Ignavibacteriota bacterium]
MGNKKEEIEILESFIDEYDNKISILSTNEAKSIYSNYNEENPDFIIKSNNVNIGIELFELVSSHNSNLLMSQEERELGCVNQHHLKSIRKKLKTNLLYENEELLNVAVERINDKIENKLQNYVSNKIWLLGYANKEFNFKLLDTALEDYSISFIQQYIIDNITYSERIEKVILFKCFGKNKIIEIIPKAL